MRLKNRKIKQLEMVATSLMINDNSILFAPFGIIRFIRNFKIGETYGS
jgi:hypothetical protein